MLYTVRLPPDSPADASVCSAYSFKRSCLLLFTVSGLFFFLLTLLEMNETSNFLCVSAYASPDFARRTTAQSRVDSLHHR
jgi:hypothetical protein